MFIGQPGSGFRGPFPSGSAVASPPPPAPPLLAAEAGAGPEVAAEPSALGAELTPLGSTPRSTPKPPRSPTSAGHKARTAPAPSCALRTRGSPSSVPSLGNERTRFGCEGGVTQTGHEALLGKQNASGFGGRGRGQGVGGRGSGTRGREERARGWSGDLLLRGPGCPREERGGRGGPRALGERRGQWTHGEESREATCV